jgi:hypothetical protein
MRIFLTAALIALPIVAHAESDCETAGKLTNWLATIQKSCTHHQLTSIGKQLLVEASATAMRNGGAQCILQSKKSAYQDIANYGGTKFAEIAASGDKDRHFAAYCETVGLTLNTLSAMRGGGKVVLDK